MKLFFVTRQNTPLANEDSQILFRVKSALLMKGFVQEEINPELADALIIQEKWSYKDFRYSKMIKDDPFLSKYLSKLFTLNFDDCATGLLRGLYANIPSSRINFRLHAAVPYMEYFNELVFFNKEQLISPVNLASWRGNVNSNIIRKKIVELLGNKKDCKLESTESWLNHSADEKREYVSLILNSKFSLCPAGWSASSFRIYESMALGRCPVIISDDFSPPLGPDWNSFALFWPESKLNTLYTYLLKNESRSAELGSKAKEVWNAYFSDSVLPDYYAESILGIIESSRDITLASEFKRWESRAFYRSNNWTLPKRIAIKVNHLKKKLITD